MNFSEALHNLKNGGRVTRSGWSGNMLAGIASAPMFLYLVPGSRFAVNRKPLLGIYPEGTMIDYQPHIDMRTRDGSCVPWLASQTDLLAEDWVNVEAS